jgi:hypothetical protein
MGFKTCQIRVFEAQYYNAAASNFKLSNCIC